MTVDPNDFMSKLMAGQDQYKEEQKGTSKRRRFVPGLILIGRLLPYDHDGVMRFLETFYHHYFESLKGDGWTFLACSKNGGNWDEPCDFCDSMVAHYKNHGSDRIYDAYKRKRKYKVNFYVTGVDVLPKYTVSDSDLGMWKEVLNQVIVLDLPFTIKEKVDLALDDEDLGLSIFNPLDGFDIRIKVSLKKSEDKGDMPNYDLTDFARNKYSISDDISKTLADCSDLVNQIELLKKADADRIHSAAVAEGLVAGDGDSSLPASHDSTLPSSAETPTNATNSSSDADKAPAEGEQSDDSLQSLFAKYRK